VGGGIDGGAVVAWCQDSLDGARPQRAPHDGSGVLPNVADAMVNMSNCEEESN
jgi:hypothetical protein